MSRFDYIRYDDEAARRQTEFKTQFTVIEALVNSLPTGRAAALALTHLEEAYMWVGKAIRDDQVARGKDATDQPKRGE